MKQLTILSDTFYELNMEVLKDVSIKDEISLSQEIQQKLENHIEPIKKSIIRDIMDLDNMRNKNKK